MSQITDIKLCIAGATGWSGAAIADAALSAPDIRLTSAVRPQQRGPGPRHVGLIRGLDRLLLA